jgi:hypothetical protein
MLFGVLLPAVPVGAAVLVDDSPILGGLSSGTPREDHSFNVTVLGWATVGTLVYEQAGNVGDLRAELRQNSTGGAVLASDIVGNYNQNHGLAVLAVDGRTLGGSDTFWVSEQLRNQAPSYAVEFENSPTPILTTPYVDFASTGTNGVIQTYEVALSRHDTIEVTLIVPQTYTYRYHLQLLLFGGSVTPFYTAFGPDAAGPSAISQAPENTEQHLRFIAPADGFYLLVVGNALDLSDVPYTLVATVNGLVIGDESPLQNIQDEYYADAGVAFANNPADWAFVGVRLDDVPLGRAIQATLHSPTFDSNVLALEPLSTNAVKSGIIAVNGYSGTVGPFSLVNYHWGSPAIAATTFTTELDQGVPEFFEADQPQALPLLAGEIVRGFQVFLNASETLELHAGVDPLFTYPYELDLFAFAPTGTYYSGSGTGTAGPFASARSGVSRPQDLTFTAPVTGFYGMAVLSLNSTYDVPLEITVTIQGRTLAPGQPRVGALPDANPSDSFQFNVGTQRWGVVASRITTPSGSYTQRLLANGFDTTPVAWDNVSDAAAGVPYGFEVVNGYRLASPSDYYLQLARLTGSAGYTVEFDSAPSTIPALNVSYPSTVPAGELVQGYEIHLNTKDTVDFRLRVPTSYTYPYTLKMFIFSPENLYYSLGGNGAPKQSGNSSGAANTEQDLVLTAPVTGYYLLAVVNLGQLSATPFAIDVTVNGQPIFPSTKGTGELTASNKVDFFGFSAFPSGFTVAGVKPLAVPSGTWSLAHSLHGPTVDSLALATDRVTTLGGEGIVVIDGFGLAGNTSFFLSETGSITGSGRLQYEVDVQTSFTSLAAASQVVSGTLLSTSHFTGYTLRLDAGQTLDMRLQRAEGYSYAFDLGLYLFSPGLGNASVSGEGGARPVSSSNNGPISEQDGMFTASRTATYLILVVNRGLPMTINFTLKLGLDGWPLTEDLRPEGDLNGYNVGDQYRFDAAQGAWSAVGLRWTEGPAGVRGGLHTQGLNTVPVATVDTSTASMAAVLPIFSPAGAANSTSTMFFNATLVPGPQVRFARYMVDYNGQPAVWPNADIGSTHAFNISGTGFLALHVLQLEQGDWVDVRAFVSTSYTKTKDIRIALYAQPRAPNLVQTEALAWSTNAAGLAQNLTYQADAPGNYLLIVTNLGPVDTVPYQLSVERHTFRGSPPARANVTIVSADKTQFVVQWSQSDEADFLHYEVWINFGPTLDGAVHYSTLSERTNTTELVKLPTFRPGQTWWVIVGVVDTEDHSTWSDPRGVTLQAEAWYENLTIQVFIAAGAAIAAIVILGWWAMRNRPEAGAPRKSRADKAGGVVEERKRGPRGKPRSPKVADEGEEDEGGAPTSAPGMPAAPSTQSQEAVNYMQRVMKGAR